MCLWMRRPRQLEEAILQCGIRPRCHIFSRRGHSVGKPAPGCTQVTPPPPPAIAGSPSPEGNCDDICMIDVWGVPEVQLSFF